jgi:uncharacterized membrane protein (UPF0127 family)
MRSLPSLVPLLALALASCGAGESSEPSEAAAVDAPLLAFDTAAVRIATGTDTLPLRVELALDDEQRALGLMERPALPADAGMLFWYPQPRPADTGFWMFRTRIPLDIAFLGADGVILAVRAMEPCVAQDPRWCPSYPAGAEFRGALEVNRGFFERHGIGPGDRVLVPGDLLQRAR